MIDDTFEFWHLSSPLLFFYEIPALEYIYHFVWDSSRGVWPSVPVAVVSQSLSLVLPETPSMVELHILVSSVDIVVSYRLLPIHE